jgi:hypothetical protein
MKRPTTTPIPTAPPRHTAAAIRIAETITGDEYASRTLYSTAWGRKTVRGLADMIDSETHLPELLRECGELLHRVWIEHTQDHQDGTTDAGSEADPRQCSYCAWLQSVQRLIDRTGKGECDR